MAINNNMTGIGAANAIGFKKRKVSGGSYISPDLLDSLVGVWEVHGKSNKDSDRNIIKNKIKDRGGDFELVNFNYEGTSGYNGYPVVFGIGKTYGGMPNNTNFSYTVTSTTVNITKFSTTHGLIYSYLKRNGELETQNLDYPSYKIKVSGLEEGFGLMYQYNSKANATSVSALRIEANGIYTIPKSFASDGSLTNANVWIGFVFTGTEQEQCNVTIEVLPEYKGAVVTDGVDDMIISTKTVSEMLEGSNEVTVISMIRQIKNSPDSIIRNNWMFRPEYYLENRVSDESIGKSGIYGYTSSNISGAQVSVINNILGDKNDYTGNSKIESTSLDYFSVEGFRHSDGNMRYLSQVAWYWTFIAKKALTTDEINQVIAYYNLDKYVKPDIYYDVKKQGLSNNTPDADWYLKDYSGNGRDMQLSNFGKKLGSGVGEYKEDFTNWQQTYAGTAIISHDKLRINKASDINNGFFIAWKLSAEIKAFRAKITGIPKGQSIRYIYVKDKFIESVTIDTDGEYDFPHSLAYTSGVGFIVNSYFPKESYIGVTIEQIPDYEGALVFDAVEDYGQFVGDLGLKDYTVAVDRAYPRLNVDSVPVVSNITRNNITPFLFEYANANNTKPYSFGTKTDLSPMELSRKISYQSTYIYDGTAINKGVHGNTGDGLTIGRFGIDTQYANIALWSLLLFPYTLSEFLLERQLKRYKLGTLYPDMVKFRPIINSNHEYTNIIFRNTSTGDNLEIGEYYDLRSISIFIQPINIDEVSVVKVNDIKAEFHSYDSNSKYYRYDAIVTKSPQKIDITIDEYIRYEDIVHPYPTIFRLTDVDNNKEYTYGDKLKIGNKVKIASVKNLLPELYSPVGTGIYNGDTVVSGNVITVEKTMTFGWSKPFTYLKSNEPNCIADPQRLRIPNSSYKILGYIPDISGHGNHLKINNSAYAGMSGANGYPYNYNDFSVDTKYAKIINGEKVEFFGYNNSVTFFRRASSYKGKIKITGLNDAIASGKIRHLQVYTNSTTNNEASVFKADGTYDINVTGIGDPSIVYFYVLPINTLKPGTLDSPIYLEQIGNYEGSFCLDGVDDFITIPTLSHGAKQVLMKVNNQKLETLIFDERINGTRMFINSQNDTLAYNGSDVCYIDGIRNLNIKTNDLLNVTHNITCLTSNTDMGTPVIGKYKAVDNYYAKMALFAFMSFDDISSEDEIKELNDIVGIEGGYVESPDYYWDAYGKSNTQADDIDNGIKGVINSRHNLFDKSITGLEAIKQTNVDGSTGRIHNRAFVNKNFAFNGESGYGGWLGVNDLTNSLNYNNSTVNNWKRGGTFIKDKNRNVYPYCGSALAIFIDNTNYILKFKVKITGLTDTDELYIRQYHEDSVAEQQLFNGINEVTLDISTSTNPINRYISFRYPPLTNDVDFEFLYEYQNGLISDGVDDHLINTVIPAFTDFTVIAKRKFLSTELKLNESFCTKGDKDYAGVGNAFVMEYFNANDLTSKQTHILSFGENNTISREESDISWCTPTSYNNITINRGEREDTVGLSIGIYSNVYWKGVFYKMMLYSKTIDMLSINMLKNLFEKDELIDVNNPIFKKYEDNE